MRYLLLLLIAVASPASTTFGQARVRLPSTADTSTEIDLGSGLQARVGYDGGVKFLYLPGRERPIGFPYGVYVAQAVVSPDRLTIAFRLSCLSDYFGCLVCHRSDTTDKATWAVDYTLMSAELLLRFDLRTWVDTLHSITNEGRATLKLAQYDKQAPPAAVIRTWEEWDMFAGKRLKKIKDAQPHDEF